MQRLVTLGMTSTNLVKQIGEFVIGEPIIRPGIKARKNPLYYTNFSKKSGTSTGIALSLLSYAIFNPYKWVEINDHENGSAMNVFMIIQDIVRKMQYEHIYFKRDVKHNKIFVSFGDPK